MHTLYLDSEQATLKLGRKLGLSLAAGDTIALRGELGAGKTTLARGLITALCGEQDVPSPTYTLVQTYDGQHCEIWHCDMYRLERPEDAYELGLMDAFEEAICLIEWPDRLGNLLPETALNVTLTFEGQGRKVILSGWEGRNIGT